MERDSDHRNRRLGSRFSDTNLHCGPLMCVFELHTHLLLLEHWNDFSVRIKQTEERLLSLIFTDVDRENMRNNPVEWATCRPYSGVLLEVELPGFFWWINLDFSAGVRSFVRKEDKRGAGLAHNIFYSSVQKVPGAVKERQNLFTTEKKYFT